MATFSPSFKASLSLWKSRLPLAAGSCGRPSACTPSTFVNLFITGGNLTHQKCPSDRKVYPGMKTEAKERKPKKDEKCNLYSRICNCSLVLKAGYMSCLKGSRCWLPEPRAQRGLVRGTQKASFISQPTGGFQTSSRSCSLGWPASSPGVHPQNELTHLGRNWPINS